MSRRKKNAGHGFGMDFHGAFSSKADAKKKERKVHGFIRPTTIKGERRYVVMSERKNPRPRKKSSDNPVFFDTGIQKYTAHRYDKKFGNIYASGFTKKEALKNLRDRLRQYRKGGAIEAHRGYGHGATGNPMDLVVMGANPSDECADERLEAYRAGRSGKRHNAAREVVVHPGETITLKVNPSAEEIREEFTGREYEYTFISDEPHMKAGDYAQIGDMVGISFKPKNGGQVEAIGWYEGSDRIPLHEAAKTLRTLTEAPVLVSDETRRQLYFVSGNQDLSLLILGYVEAGNNPKDRDLWELGDARTVVYREKKWMDDFRTINYQHRFGEENGRLPKLLYDARLKLLLLEGGDYEVRPEGITN